MKIESTSFGPAEVTGLLEELVIFERDRLVERLEAASAEFATLAGQVESGSGGDAVGWSAHEVVAHVAAFSKLYGMMTYKVGIGDMTEFDLVAMVNRRDPTAEALLAIPPAELVEMAQADHRRTAGYLRRATAEELERRVDLGPIGSLSAAEIARLALVSHLEQHVRQLREALARS